MSVTIFTTIYYSESLISPYVMVIMINYYFTTITITTITNESSIEHNPQGLLVNSQMIAIRMTYSSHHHL